MSDKEKNIMFRSAVGGFNKKDVNLYIYNENKRFASIEQSYINTIEELRRELDEKLGEIRRMSEHIDALEGVSEKLAEAEKELDIISKEHKELQTTALGLTVKLEESNAYIKDIEESLGATRFEKESAEKALEEAKIKYDTDISVAVASAKAEYEAKISDIRSSFDADILTLKQELTSVKLSAESADIEKNSAVAGLNTVKNELDSLRIQLEAEKAKNSALTEENAAIIEKKARDTKEAENMADELISRAKQASEDILSRAEEGAAIIIERAKNEAFSFREDIFSAAREMISTAADELHRSVGICLTDFVNGMRSSSIVHRRATDEARHFNDDLSGRIMRMQSDLDRAIAEKLAEFDRKHGSVR